jgi:hypothetical protein
MTATPSSPKIYHITHIDNLPSIAITAGGLSMGINRASWIDPTIATKAKMALANAGHQPTIAVEPTWYF